MQAWSDSVVSSVVDIQKVLSFELGIPDKLEGERSVRIDVPSKNNPDSTESVRVKVLHFRQQSRNTSTSLLIFTLC